jgi:hypothetical protein
LLIGVTNDGRERGHGGEYAIRPGGW